MKKLGKFLANVLIVAYAVIAISVTILLLSYNDYHNSVIGGYTFILVTDDELEEYGYDEGSLVLVKETKAKNINEGDYVFLYKYITTSQFEIKYARVLAKDTSKGEYQTQYILDGNTIVDYEDIIGSTKDIKVIPNLGTILSILESRYGYLFLIVVVSFIAFLYEIYELIMEIKYGDREEEYEDDDEYEYEDDDEYEYEDDDEYEDEEYEEEEIVVKPKRKTAPKKTTTSSKTTKKATTTRKTTTSSGATKKVAPKNVEPKATKKATTATRTTKASTSTAKKSTTKTNTAKKTTAKTGTAKKSTKKE